MPGNDMYVRFVTPLIDPSTRVETGIFQSKFQLRENGCADWILRELQPHWDWFNEHLAVPTRLGMHFRRRESIWGVCWFRPQATAAIARAWRCRALMEEGGIPVRALVWRGRVQVLWSDDQQAVIAPSKGMPRGFH